MGNKGVVGQTPHVIILGANFGHIGAILKPQVCYQIGYRVGLARPTRDTKACKLVFKGKKISKPFL